MIETHFTVYHFEEKNSTMGLITLFWLLNLVIAPKVLKQLEQASPRTLHRRLRD